MKFETLKHGIEEVNTCLGKFIYKMVITDP